MCWAADPKQPEIEWKESVLPASAVPRLVVMCADKTLTLWSDVASRSSRSHSGKHYTCLPFPFSVPVMMGSTAYITLSALDIRHGVGAMDRWDQAERRDRPCDAVQAEEKEAVVFTTCITQQLSLLAQELRASATEDMPDLDFHPDLPVRLLHSRNAQAWLDATFGPDMVMHGDNTTGHAEGEANETDADDDEDGDDEDDDNEDSGGEDADSGDEEDEDSGDEEDEQDDEQGDEEHDNEHDDEHDDEAQGDEVDNEDSDNESDKSGDDADEEDEDDNADEDDDADEEEEDEEEVGDEDTVMEETPRRRCCS